MSLDYTKLIKPTRRGIGVPENQTAENGDSILWRGNDEQRMSYVREQRVIRKNRVFFSTWETSSNALRSPIFNLRIPAMRPLRVLRTHPMNWRAVCANKNWRKQRANSCSFLTRCWSVCECVTPLDIYHYEFVWRCVHTYVYYICSVRCIFAEIEKRRIFVICPSRAAISSSR